MAICTKCNIDKEVDQYATYFHSTQNKVRTRRICKSCFNHQKSIYRESIKKEKIIEPTPVSVSFTPIPTPSIIPTPLPEYKKDGRGRPRLVDESVFIGMEDKVCYTCKIEKPASEFYIHRKTLKLFTSCKQCDIDREKKEYQQYLEENGGSDRVKLKPGEWSDKFQQENVESFLKLIGWKHNGRHWYKEGVRSGEDGVWEKMRSGEKKYIRKSPVIIKPRPIVQKLRSQIEDIVKLRNEGVSFKELCTIYNTSAPTLSKIINEYYEKKETR
jgi:uncharacterized protein (DUF433 family)